MAAALRFRRAFDVGGLTWVAFQDFPGGACGDASELLGQYLTDCVFGAWTYVSAARTDGWTHAWVEQDGLIADITADQFPDVTEPCVVTANSEWHGQWDGRMSPHPASLSSVAHIGRDVADDYALLRARADGMKDA